MHMEQNNLDVLKKRGFLALEDGNWKEATTFFEAALNQNAEDAECYIGKLLAKMHVHKREEIRNCKKLFEQDPDYQKALRFDPSIETEFQEALNCINENRKSAKAEMLKKGKVISKWTGVGAACLVVLILAVLFIVKLARRCPECKGDGTITCASCENGKVDCSFCEGKKFLQCGYCLDDNGKSTGTVPCEHCNADGVPYCETCEGDGRVESGSESCMLCNGSGSVPGVQCYLCHGKGYYLSLGTEHTCPDCYGTGYKHRKCILCGGDGRSPIIKRCENCNGSGLLKGQKCSYCKGTHTQACSECKGEKVIACPTCKGTAKIKCSKCKGTASLKCPQCHGTGKKAKKS